MSTAEATPHPGTADLPPGLPADWPLRSASRRVRAGGLDWHVQLLGRGPLLVLLHGTGASTHSFAAMVPRLAAHATVLVPDLPGHGHTRGAQPADLTLPGMARALQALLQALRLPPPAALAGHSAGAALALRWALDLAPPVAGRDAPGAGDAAVTSVKAAAAATRPRVLGFAPSLVAPPEAYTRWIAPLVNPVATASWTAALGARIARGTGLVDALLDSTGSALTPAQRALYRRLFADPAHVRGAVGFMAAADLPALLAQAARQPPAAAFVLGTRDRWIPERLLAPVIAQYLPQAEVARWDAGHVLHEEDPQRAADWVLARLPWVAGDAAGAPAAGATGAAAAAAPPPTVRPGAAR